MCGPSHPASSLRLPPAWPGGMTTFCTTASNPQCKPPAQHHSSPILRVSYPKRFDRTIPFPARSCAQGCNGRSRVRTGAYHHELPGVARCTSKNTSFCVFRHLYIFWIQFSWIKAPLNASLDPQSFHLCSRRYKLGVSLEKNHCEQL